jgi:hypothetical protein
MATTTFDELVRQEQQAKESAAAESYNAFKERDEWLERLEELYRQVGGFLADYVASGQVVVSFEPIRIEEEAVGLYQAKQMVISIGRKTVRLEPIGTFLNAMKGRVDVIGPGARGRIVLLEKSVTHVEQLIHGSFSFNEIPTSPPTPRPASEIEWRWKIMGRPPKMQISELTKETFLDLLAEVGNG